MSEQATGAPAPVEASNGDATSNQGQSQDLQSQPQGQAAQAQQVAADAKDVLTDPNASKAQKAQAAKTLKSLKFKYDGKEYEESLPFEIPDTKEAREYMQNKLSKDRLGTAKAQESANQQKMMQQFFSDLRKDPRKVLSDPNVGVDLKKIAVQLIEEEIENSKKSPDQLEREKLQKELQSIKEEREREKEDFNTRELARLEQQEYERYDNLITQAIDKTDLPKSPYIVKKMADYMLLGLQNNIDVAPEDVLPLVREEMQNDLRDMFAVMPEEVIESIVGKDVINRIRKKNLQKAKAGPVAAVQQISKAKSTDTGKTAKSDEGKTAEKKTRYGDFFGI